MRVTWLIHMCVMTHSYVWHDSFICVTWLIHTCDMTHSYVCHDSFICVPWLIHMCEMTHSHVWHDSFIFVTRFGGFWRCSIFSRHDGIHMRQNLFTCVTWLIRAARAMTSLYVWHDLGMCHMPQSCVTWIVWHKCDMTQSFAGHKRDLTQFFVWHKYDMAQSSMWYVSVNWRGGGLRLPTRGGGLGSSIIFKNLMSSTPRRKWYLTTGRRAH